MEKPMLVMECCCEGGSELACVKHRAPNMHMACEFLPFSMHFPSPILSLFLPTTRYGYFGLCLLGCITIDLESSQVFRMRFRD